MDSPPTQALAKGKSVVTNSRFKDKPIDRSKDLWLEKGKSSNHIRTYEITYLKCKGMGHMARKCLNARIMIITPTRDYDSQYEDEVGDDEEIIYAKERESMLILRALNLQSAIEEFA